MRLNLTIDGKLERLPDGPHLPNMLSYASVIQWKGHLVVTGGYSKIGYFQQIQNSAYIFNTRQSPPTWVPGPKLNTARHSHFSFLMGDTVYVGAGDDKHEKLSSVEMMDLSLTNPSWTFTNNFPNKVTIITFMLALQLISISNNN